METRTSRHRLALSLALGLLCVASAAWSQGLCPEVIASLSTVPSKADWNTTAQRVEIRRCALFPERGTGRLQLVAWRTGDVAPALVFDPELYDGIVQLAMIEGVYAFHFTGGLAQPVVVIVYEKGAPKIALHESSWGEVKVTSKRREVVVELADRSGQTRRYEFQGSDSGARRW